MKRRRRLWLGSAISMVVILLSSWCPNAVLAAAFTYNCHSPISIDYQDSVDRGAGLGGSGSDYHAVIGDANVRSLATCSSPSGIAVLSAVLPANLQSSAGIVQLGYGMCSVPPGFTSCGDSTSPVPADGHLHFLYICGDRTGGNVCNADGWGNLTVPQVGHRYRFRLETVSATGTWKYTITDKGSGATGTASIPATWNQGNGAWWGAENYDSNGQLGAKSTDTTQIDMYWMQYLRDATGSAWQVAHPVAHDVCELRLSANVCTGSWPTWYKRSVYNQNYSDGDAIRIWTVAH